MDGLIVEAAANIEGTLDVVEAAIESVPEVVKNNPVVLIGAVVISLAVGAGVATVISNKHFKTKYERLSTQEIQEAREFYQKRFKTEDSPETDEPIEETPEESSDNEIDISEVVEAQTEMVEAAIDILSREGYVAYDKQYKSSPQADAGQNAKEVLEVKTSIKKNIFDNRSPIEDRDEEYDLDVEMSKKAVGKPYIIEAEAFFENDGDHSQTTLTWYEEDEVLADERDQHVRNIEGVIGSGNLRFGCGSKDRNVVYITNDRFSADYEITRDTGSYTEKVLGIRNPTERNPIRKFRDTD